MKDLLNRELPKWPQMLVTGDKITEEQALEIIRRTDSFFSWPSGNNHAFIKEAKKALKFMDYSDYTSNFNISDYHEYNARKEKYLSKWGHIHLEYIKNNWISSSYIGGPHGWCHPDGTIQYSDNIGKWPSVEDVFKEWTVVAKEFPFLCLEAILMDGENVEESVNPVVVIRVVDGEAILKEPVPFKIINDTTEHINTITDIFKRRSITFDDGRNGENAIPLATLKKWGDTMIGYEDIWFS